MAQSERMLKRVPDPHRPGELVEALPLRVMSGDVDASLVVDLEDGAKITVTLSITGVSRIDTRKDANGRPIYNIDTQGKININHPPEGRQ